MKSHIKKTVLKISLGFIFGFVILLNPTVKEVLSLSVLRVLTGMNLVHIKIFPDAPGRLFVPTKAIRTTQSQVTGLIVVRGNLFGQHEEFSVRVDLGEVRDEWTEVRSDSIKPEDRVVILPGER